MLHHLVRNRCLLTRPPFGPLYRYHPLLQPFVHYIPVTVAADGSSDLAERVAWAEAHPEEVARIVAASSEFARRHLRPGAGRDCYAALLLREYAALLGNGTAIEPPPRLQAYTGNAGGKQRRRAVFRASQ